MDLAEFRCAPYGRALKRFQNKGEKQGYKKKLQIYYKTAKSLKNLLTYYILKSEKEGRIKMKHNYQLSRRIDKND